MARGKGLIILKACLVGCLRDFEICRRFFIATAVLLSPRGSRQIVFFSSVYEEWNIVTGALKNMYFCLVPRYLV